MRAVQVLGFDGPAAVRCREVAEPVAGPRDVVIEVRAAGVAFPDVLHTRGLYQNRFEPPFTLGGEVAGIIRSAPASSALEPGDRVVALMQFGAFAEVVAVPVHLVLPLPDELGFAEGACLPVNYLTAHFTLHERGGLRPGETVLVHGASGGVGSATVQLAAAHGPGSSPSPPRRRRPSSPAGSARTRWSMRPTSGPGSPSSRTAAGSTCWSIRSVATASPTPCGVCAPGAAACSWSGSPRARSRR